MQDPVLGIFQTPDPLTEKYYCWSPYAYCLGNPMRYIDPTGMDVWEIDRKGEIVNRIEDETQDAFYMVDKDGNRTYTTDKDGNKIYNSISFEYGTITNSQKAGWFRDATSFSVLNESSGADLFKFFADNTKVEFGLVNTMENGSTVMTNHKEGSVGVAVTVKKLSDKGQTITSVIHNHPNNSPPSGFRAGDKSGDKFAANVLPNVDLYVYQPRNNSLVMFDNQSIIASNISWGLIFPTTTAKRPIVPIRRYPGVGLPPP